MKFILIFLALAIPTYFIFEYLSKDRSADRQGANDSPAELVMIDERKRDAKAEGAEEYFLDIQRSEIEWFSKKIFSDTKHKGTVQVAEGKIHKANGELVGGDILIDMTSIENLDLKGKASAKILEDHLSSSDFFDVANFPTAKFVVIGVERLATESGGPNFKLIGDMTIKDKTNSVDFDALVTEDDKSIRIQGDLSIDRTLWEVKYGSGKFFKGLGDDLIDDIIEYKIDLIANK